jgi:hypothetical protein
MTDLAKYNVISAETVARLVQIYEYNRKKDEHAFPGIVMRRFVNKARCGKCVRNDYKNRCRFMRENRYYPDKCIAYKKEETKI